MGRWGELSGLEESYYAAAAQRREHDNAGIRHGAYEWHCDEHGTHPARCCDAAKLYYRGYDGVANKVRVQGETR